MEKSKVYFTTFKTSFTENLLQKLRRLIITAGIKDIDFKDKYAALNSILANMGIWRFCAQIMPRSWQIWSKKMEAGLF